MNEDSKYFRGFVNAEKNKVQRKIKQALLVGICQ